MRLVVVGPVHPLRGGIAHYTTLLCKTLAGQGHTVLPVTFRRQYPRWLFPGSSDRDPSRTYVALAAAQPWLDSLNPFTWMAAARRIRRAAPDVLVLQWWTGFWAPLWLALIWLHRRAQAGPILFICHNVVPHDARLWERTLAQWVLRQGDGWLVHTAPELAQLRALVGAGPAEVIPHPPYDLFEVAPVTQREARHRLALPEQGPLLLFFGMVRAYKGLDDLLAALPAVRHALPGAHLVVAGDFWGKLAQVQRRCAQLGLGDGVILRDGYVPNEEVPLYFAAADVLMAPYRRATGSGVLQTARRLGTPVIATPAAAATLAQTEWEGSVAASSDPADLAAAIVSHFRQPLPCPRQPLDARAAQAAWATLADGVVRLATQVRQAAAVAERRR
jgi:glycosyltransferase involved in cell wall biosynthesis